MTFHPQHRNRAIVPVEQRKGLFAILAIVAAIASFMVGPGLGLLLGIAAVVCGLIGFFMAASPRVSGGVMSLIAVVTGVIGFIAAILRAVF